MTEISTLLDELGKATKHYQDCVNFDAQASRNKNTALNELNKVQKKFDEAVKTLQSQAHRDTDWSREKGFAEAARKMADKS